MSLSPEQLAIREGRISATHAAMVSGCHPYRGPLDVYLEQIGEAEPWVENKRSKWGDKLEPLIRDDYEEAFGVSVEVRGTIVHPNGWACATPDGLVYPKGARLPERGLEIKVHGRDAVIYGNLVYGDEGTDEVPLHELVQSVWGINCTGLDRWDLVPFLDGAPLNFTIERDDELIAMVSEKAERLLVNNIRKHVPPEPDGSIAWDKWLKRRWEKNSEDLIDIDHIPDLLLLVADLRKHRDAQADLEIATDAITQKIKNAIGDKAGLIWTDRTHPKAAKMRKPPQSKVTWKHSASSEQSDWKATVAKMKEDVALVSSALKPEIMGALDVLHSIGEQTIGADVHTAQASQIFAVLEQCSIALEAVATFTTVMKTVSGGRPFNVPRWWKASKPDDNRSNTDTDTEEN